MNYYKICLLTIGFSFVFSSCVSKKELLYLQDIETYNNSEVTFSNSIIQENDILKIDVTSLEMSASIPFNKATATDNYSNR